MHEEIDNLRVSACATTTDRLSCREMCQRKHVRPFWVTRKKDFINDKVRSDRDTGQCDYRKLRSDGSFLYGLITGYDTWMHLQTTEKGRHSMAWKMCGRLLCFLLYFRAD